VSPFNLVILAASCLAFAPICSARAEAFVELKTQSKIAKGSPAIFKIKSADPSVRAIRLRYKNGPDEDFRWVDFLKGQEHEFKAQIEADEISGFVILYYIVLQRDDGSVEPIYGSPKEPHRILVDRRLGDAVFHQKSSIPMKRQKSQSFRDRFGDDDVVEQIAVFSARDSERHEHDFTEENAGKAAHNHVFGLLNSLPKIYFNHDLHTLVMNGIDSRARTKLRIDGLELFNEFDGSQFWDLDTINVASLAVVDGSQELVTTPGSLLGVISVVTPKKRALRAKVGVGYPLEYLGGISAGHDLWGFENYLTLSADERRFSTILHSEYAWGFVKKPFLTNQFHFFASYPKDGDLDLTWNGRINFELPLASNWDSRVSLAGGQTLHNDYNVVRTSLHLENELAASLTHQLQLFANTSFVGIVQHGESPAHALRRCEMLGLATTAVDACRLEGWIAAQDKIQLASVAVLTSSFEVVGATQENNDAASMLHPGANLQLIPSENVDVRLGYRSSVRWPTFKEKLEIDLGLSPEKLRLLTLDVHFKLKSEYAVADLELQGQSAWLMDAISAAANSVAAEHSYGVRAVLYASLASTNEIYFGVQHYTNSALFPSLKLVLGARLNLLSAGSLYLELQNPSRFYISHQTRAFLDYFFFESQILRDDRDNKYQITGNLKMFL